MRTEADYVMAYDLGFRDGVESPHDLSMGMMWEDDQDMNEAYDRGGGSLLAHGRGGDQATAGEG